MNVLRALLDAMFPPRRSRDEADRTTCEELGVFVAPSRVSLLGHDVVCLLPYREPLVRSLIVEAKFYEHTKAHAELGRVLAEYLLTLVEDAPFERCRYVLVPVPLSKKRYRERGYNQVERVLREALKQLPDTFSLDTRLVRRVRDTPPQTKLGRAARLRNMDGAFALVGTLDGSCTYIVVDDVSTTGTTLASVIDALHASSASVRGVCLAH